MLAWLANAWSKFWEAAKPDPYFHIACLMQLEGYTDYEIDNEIAAMKKANGDD